MPVATCSRVLENKAVFGKARIEDLDRRIRVALVRLEFERLGTGALLKSERRSRGPCGGKHIPAG
jgi:hypothetical protein